MNTKLQKKLNQANGGKIVEWEDVIHYVIIPNYKEHLSTLQECLTHLSTGPIAKTNIIVILAMEAAEEGCEEKALKLISKNQHLFLDMLFSIHPTGLPGETRGKASNEAWALKQIIGHTQRQGYDVNNITITTCDADSLFHEKYFENLTFKFCTDTDRYTKIWQAPMLFLKNFKTIPSITRAYTQVVSMHELSCLANENDEHLPASTYSLSLKLALDVNGWDTDFIAEDWHMFLKCFFETSGKAVVEPIFLPIVSYSVESDTWWQSIKDRITQAHRHAMGIQETVYCTIRVFHSLFFDKKKGISLSRLFSTWYKVNSACFIPPAYFYCTIMGYILIGYYSYFYPDLETTFYISGKWSFLFRYLNLFQSVGMIGVWIPISFRIVKMVCKHEKIHWYSLLYMMVEMAIMGFPATSVLVFYPLMKAAYTIAFSDHFEYVVAAKPKGVFEEEYKLSEIENQNTAQSKMLHGY
jgi:hypothetical protein